MTNYFIFINHSPAFDEMPTKDSPLFDKIVEQMRNLLPRQGSSRPPRTITGAHAPFFHLHFRMLFALEDTSGGRFVRPTRGHLVTKRKKFSSSSAGERADKFCSGEAKDDLNLPSGTDELDKIYDADQ